MIRRVIIRRFKKFQDVTFDVPGHIVLAGPNNSGKTTMLQAVAAWSLAFEAWKTRNDFQRHKGAYSRVPITRHVFSAVPLRAFDLLWKERDYRGSIEIEIQATAGWQIAIEFIADSTEQIYVRPKPDADPETLRKAHLSAVFVPPMTGLATEEPVYQPPKLNQLLGMARPGEVLRNLLVEANRSEPAWSALQSSMRRLFDAELLPPDAQGPNILAEYRRAGSETRLDIGNAGSGFQQVLMLLTFLNTRPASVLLLDEPDAHLHMILQDAIYGELREVASKQKSQLIIATHSEVIINSVEARELCAVLDKPRMLADNQERNLLIESLSVLTHTDILQALEATGILYLDDYTDLSILRAWAAVLGHPARALLEKIFWKPATIENRAGAKGISAKDHYEALQLVRGLPALQILDGDGRPEIPATAITGKGLQRIRWTRYEVESYLLHPEALARYVAWKVGTAAAPPHLEDLRKHLEDTLPPAILRDPLGNHDYLNATKARTKLISPALQAAGLPEIHYTSYFEIAELMKPEEIHPEVSEKLDAIVRAFGE
jgi:energy-coupling factor transporter ATP-binding protein EcfA2